MADDVDVPEGDPVPAAYQATDPENAPRVWSAAETPTKQLGVYRDFYRTHAIAGRSFGEMNDNFKRAFPDADDSPSEDTYSAWQKVAGREARMDAARSRVSKRAAAGNLPAGESEGTGAYLAREAVSPIRQPLSDLNYAYAQGAIKDGTATDDQYEASARYERERGLNQDQPGWAKWVGEGLGAAGGIAPMMLSGGASLGLQTYAASAAQTGEGVFSAKAAVGAAVPLATQLSLLKATGPLAEKLFPGAQSMWAKAGTRGLTFTGEMALADYGTKLAGLSETGGPIQALIEGHPGDAARQAFVNAVVGTGMGLLDSLRRGYSPKAAAEQAAEKAQEAGRQIIETAAQNTRAQEPAPAETAPNAPGEAPPAAGQPAVGGPNVAPSEATGPAYNVAGFNVPWGKVAPGEGYSPEPPAGNAAPPGKPSTWLTEAIDRHNQDAERAGVADLIEQRAGEGAIGATIVQEIKPKLAAAGMDPADARTIVNAVRSRRGIPSQDDTAEFAKWQGEWRARQQSSSAPPDAWPPERVETIRAALKAIGMNSAKWTAEKVRAEAERLGIDKAVDRPDAAQAISESAKAEPPPAESAGESIDDVMARLSGAGVVKPTESAESAMKPGEVKLADGSIPGHHVIVDHEGNEIGGAWINDRGPDRLPAMEINDRGEPLTGDQKKAAIEQLAVAHPEVDRVEVQRTAGAKKDQIREVSLDRVRERVERLNSDKASPPVLPVDSVRDRVLAGEEVPADELRRLGLTGREAHVVRERALNKRQLADIGGDKELGGRVYTKEFVRQIEKAAREKLGIKVSFEQAIIAREKAANVANLAERGGAVDAGELHAVGEHVRPIVRKKLDALDKAQDALDALAGQFEKEANDAGANGLSPERRAFFDAEAARIHNASQGQPAKATVEPGRPAGQAPERPAGEPAPVRRAEPEPVRPGVGPVENPQPGAGAPAAAHAGGEAADAGQSQAAGDQLKRPMPPFEREWRKKAEEAGVSYDALKAGADQVLAENAGKVDEHNEIVRRAMHSLDVEKFQQDKIAGKLKPTGFNWASVRALAGEDHASVPGIDGIAQELAESFGRPDLDPEKLFDMLREGIRRPLTKTEAHQAALDEWNDHKEAERAKKEAQGLGWPRGAVEEALRRGQADGRSEADDREGDASGGDLDDAIGGIGDFDPSEFGKPLSDAERANFPGGGQPDAGEGRRLRNTALANAQIDQERALQKLPPILSGARLANPEVWDKAMARIAADPLAGDKLVRELAGKTRPTSVEENALLLWQKVANANEYRRVVGQYVEAMKPGGAKDAFDLDALEKRESELASQRDMIDDVARRTGTEWGRAGQFRKQLAAEDFSLAGMLQALRGAKGSKPPTPEEIAQVHALQQKIEGLQKQLADAEAAFAGVQKPTAAAEIVKMPELKGLLAAQTAEAGARGEFKEMLGKARADRQTFAQSFIDTLIKLRVNEVISSPTTLAKIAAASAERFVETPANEAVGAILSRLPGLARIAALAPREGRGFNLGTEKQAAYQGLTQGVVDAYKKITTGRSDLDVLHGKNDVPRGWLDLQFGLHDGLKAPAERAEYTRSMLQRMDAESAAGKDPTTPAALLRISGEAYRDAQAAKFRQDNALVDIYNRAVGTLRASENPALNAVGVAARLLVPVVRVPTNLAMEVGNYAFGTGLGSARLVRAWMNGVENLKPEQADLIMRNFKKGSLGAALLAVGYFNPQSFGGYYAGKRDEKDVKVGSIRMGGVDIPAWLLHNPALEVLQMGATVRRASDKIYKHQEQGTGVGIGQGLAGWVEGIPLAREATDLSKAISPDPKERGRWLGETAKSFAVPQFVSWIAGQTDLNAKGEPQKRKPQGFIQTVETGIPGLRQRVPAGR